MSITATAPEALATEIDQAFGHWLAGFIDGEGCFCIREHGITARVRRVHLSCHFTIALRNDDAGILYEISERTGIGTVTSGERTNGNPKATWRVVRKRDCLVLVALLDAFPLRAKKRADFEVWREAVLLWQEMARGGAPGLRGQVAYDWTQMSELRNRLIEGRVYA